MTNGKNRYLTRSYCWLTDNRFSYLKIVLCTWVIKNRSLNNHKPFSRRCPPQQRWPPPWWSCTPLVSFPKQTAVQTAHQIFMEEQHPRCTYIHTHTSARAISAARPRDISLRRRQSRPTEKCHYHKFSTRYRWGVATHRKNKVSTARRPEWEIVFVGRGRGEILRG